MGHRTMSVVSGSDQQRLSLHPGISVQHLATAVGGRAPSPSVQSSARGTVAGPTGTARSDRTLGSSPSDRAGCVGPSRLSRARRWAGSAGCLPCIPAVVSNPVELLVGEVTVRVELSTAPRKAHTMEVAAARPVRDDSAMTVIKELVVGRGGHTSTAVGPQSAVEW